jgi:hypothetical protein|tara:strand:- start:650 stop:1231 length:582 start_codon:yes stop_codon:yes gene_type:complete
MRVLILRTFAHTLVWDGYKQCTYFRNQLEKDILSWEPGYLNFRFEQFRYALGIYIKKYFTYKTSTNNVVFWNTTNEQAITLLKLMPYKDTSSFMNYSKDRKEVVVHYQYKGKLWKKPDRKLMNKIDESFIEEKMNELQSISGAVPMTSWMELSLLSSFNKEVFYPLSFSLDEKVVKKVLEEFNIDLQGALDLI